MKLTFGFLSAIQALNWRQGFFGGREEFSLSGCSGYSAYADSLSSPGRSLGGSGIRLTAAAAGDGKEDVGLGSGYSLYAGPLSSRGGSGER
jgi:hypothetical protein